MKKQNKIPFLIAACLSTVVLAIVNSSFGTMTEPIAEHFLGGDGASQGFPNSAMQIGCIIAVLALAFVGGRLCPHQKPTLLAASAFVMAVAMLTLGAELSFGVFVGVFAVVGLAYGTIDVTASALVADVYGDRAAEMMCLLHGSHGAAGIIAPIVSVYILGHSDRWTLPYTLIGFFVLSVLIYLCALPIPLSRRMERQNGLAHEKNVGFEKSLLPLALSIALFGIYNVGMICYTKSYEGSLGGEKAITLSLFYFGVTASRLAMPLISRLFGLRFRTYLRLAPFLSAALLFSAVLAKNAALYIILSTLSSFIAGAFIPIAISTACELMSGNTTGASTYMNLAMLLGNSISSPIIAAVTGSLGARAGMMIPVLALVLCGAVTAIRVR